MADNIQEAHNGVWAEAAPWEDLEFSLTSTHRKPLNRQISEFSAIRRAKTQGVALFNGKKIEVKKEVFNSKDEWFSHIRRAKT